MYMYIIYVYVYIYMDILCIFMSRRVGAHGCPPEETKERKKKRTKKRAYTCRRQSLRLLQHQLQQQVHQYKYTSSVRPHTVVA
jgi:hypothetical protein